MAIPVQALTVDVVSDIVCPWCWIGKKRIEAAMALRPEIPTTLRFHPYLLNDWIPREGISREEYLTKKFGSVDRYKAIAVRVAEAAAQEGLTYNLDRISRQPNTIDSHRLILWAGQNNHAAQMKQRLMDLYFAEGADLTDRSVLVQAAADCGLDPAKIEGLLASDTDVVRVTQQAQSAKAAGIEGVPCFILGGILAVSGAQSPDYLAGALERAAAERAPASQAEAAGS